MGDEHEGQLRETSIPRFEAGKLNEFVSADDDRRDSQGLQQDGAVDTPRRA